MGINAWLEIELPEKDSDDEKPSWERFTINTDKAEVGY